MSIMYVRFYGIKLYLYLIKKHNEWYKMLERSHMLCIKTEY